MMSMPARAPWFVWTSLASVTCIVFGVYWDISWHMSIGRDSFWTPAHLAIQLGGIVAAGGGAALILATTLRPATALRAASIRVWGFRGPFGAFLSVWGGATMIVSAPFDDWWHRAYGLDVKILSPPHVVLQLGILAVAVGGIVLVTAALNRATAEARRRLEWISLVIGGEVLVLAMIAIAEETARPLLHAAASYRAMAVVAPVVLIAIARASRRRWATTIVAASYTALMLAGLWIAPLVPAAAKLGPVYQPITHLIPLDFPILLIVPAVAIDVIGARGARRPRWLLAIAMGAAFLVTLVAVQWPFGTFLSSPAAHNPVFGAHYLPYFIHPDWYEARGAFVPAPDLGVGMAIALLAAIASAGAGLLLGDAMQKVQR
jgi:hypothetical protein